MEENIQRVLQQEYKPQFTYMLNLFNNIRAFRIKNLILNLFTNDDQKYKALLIIIKNFLFFI